MTTEWDQNIPALIRWLIQAMGEAVVLNGLGLDQKQLEDFLTGRETADDAVRQELARLTGIAKDIGLGEPPPPELSHPDATTGKDIINVGPPPPSVRASQTADYSSGSTAHTRRTTASRQPEQMVSAPSPPKPVIRSVIPKAGPLRRTSVTADPGRLDKAVERNRDAMCLIGMWGELKRDMEKPLPRWTMYSTELAAVLIELTLMRSFSQYEVVRKIVPGPQIEGIQKRIKRVHRLTQQQPSWTESLWHWVFGGGPEGMATVLQRAASPQLPNYPLTPLLLASILEAGSE